MLVYWGMSLPHRYRGSGGEFHFVLGLAVTQIVDAVFQELKIVAVFFDVVVLGFFVAAGAFAARGHLWAFWVGAVAYLADGLVFALFADWVPAAFHAYALYCIVQGVIALRNANEQRNQGVPPTIIGGPTPAQEAAPQP